MDALQLVQERDRVELEVKRAEEHFWSFHFLVLSRMSCGSLDEK